MAEGLWQYVFLMCRFLLNLDLMAGASESIGSIGFHSSYIYGDWLHRFVVGVFHMMIWLNTQVIGGWLLI